MAELSITFRGTQVPITHPAVSRDLVEKALACEMFQTWVSRTEKEVSNKKIVLHGVEIQSVDMFGALRVGFVKLKADASLCNNGVVLPAKIPGIALLRGNAVGILVKLQCEDGKAYTVLVDQARIPIGAVSCLELPAGMIDFETDTIVGTAAMELEQECGIRLKASELINLTDLAFADAYEKGNLPYLGIAPSPGGCDEFIGIAYVEKKVTVLQLEEMNGRLWGLREDGEHITLRIAPFDEAWRISGDSKFLCAIFMLEKLQAEGILPPSLHPVTTLGEEALLTP